MYSNIYQSINEESLCKDIPRSHIIIVIFMFVKYNMARIQALFQKYTGDS